MSDVKLEPTAEEIERVARAMCRNVSGKVTFWHRFKSTARVAILAMDRSASPPTEGEAFQAVVEVREWSKGQLGSLKETIRLRRERTSPPAPAVAVPEGDVSDTWSKVFGGPYMPVVWGKHQAIRTESISHAARIAQQRAPECADVIAALVFWLGVERNRAARLAAAPEPPAPRTYEEGRDDGIEAAKWLDAQAVTCDKTAMKSGTGRLRHEWELAASQARNFATAILSLKGPGDA